MKRQPNHSVKLEYASIHQNFLKMKTSTKLPIQSQYPALTSKPKHPG